MSGERSVSTFMTHIQLEHIMMAKKQHTTWVSRETQREIWKLKIAWNYVLFISPSYLFHASQRRARYGQWSWFFNDHKARIRMYDARLSDYCAFAVESRAECVYLSLMVDWKLTTDENKKHWEIDSSVGRENKGKSETFQNSAILRHFNETLFAASPSLIGDRLKSIPLTIVNDSICDKAEKKINFPLKTFRTSRLGR